MSARSLVHAWLAAALAVCGAGGAARSQDFSPAAGAGPRPGAAALLDRALPMPDGVWAIEAGATRWFALPELETRALATAGAWRSVSAAAGLSQTGDPGFGWSTAALALGSAGESGGMALRVAARHERRDGALSASSFARAGGLEAGAGAWLSLGGAWRVWSAAPHVWTHGEAPPLARPLQLGIVLRTEDGAAWVAIEAPRAGADGARLLGGELSAGPFTLWAEARDGPWRASLGLAAARGPLAVHARVDAHPELPETTRLYVSLARPVRPVRRVRSAP